MAPPPEDYVPEPLVAPPSENVVEESTDDSWTDGSLSEEIVEPTPEEIERDRIAQEKYEELQRRKKEEEEKAEELNASIEKLRRENEELTRQKNAAEKAREEKILAARNKATQSGVHQMNLVKQRKPSLLSRLKQFLRERRVKVATVGIKNYETAILERARIAVPKMLDDIEKMHEQLTILEELLVKYSEVKKKN